MRNPFKRTRAGQEAAPLIVNAAELEQRFMETHFEYDGDPEVGNALLMNKLILELGVGVEDQDGPDREGSFIIFLVDMDGFVLSQDGEYLLPPEIRNGNTWARLGL